MYVACSVSVVLYRVDVNVESPAPLCPRFEFDSTAHIASSSTCVWTFNVTSAAADVQCHVGSGVTH
jgi:hypothetical protein